MIGSKLEERPDTSERVLFEKIGNQEWELREVSLDVHNDVALWSENPRLWITSHETYSSEIELEGDLRGTRGYDGLKKSIREIGQMHSIYVQKTNTGKYLVLEGATRVTALRDLDRINTNKKKEGSFRYVKAKILPSNFGERDLRILLAGIHVRGSGVRDWGRYSEARFIYETVVGRAGHPPVMNQTELADQMGKSIGWVNRLKGAYEFALGFLDHIDGDEDAKKIVADKFSVLEEISKVRVLGSQLKDFNNSAHDALREDVFDMVKNNAFKEYRNARHLKEFHDDPDLWEQLKSGEEHIADRLAKNLSEKQSSPRTKISALPQQVKRAIDRRDESFDEDDIVSLQKTIDYIEDQVHDGVHPYRLSLKKATRTLNKASKADVVDLDKVDITDFKDAFNYFISLVETHHETGNI